MNSSRKKISSKKRFDKEIIRYMKEGFYVSAKTKDSVFLVKPKILNKPLLAFLFLLGVLPGLIYLSIFRRQDDQSILLLYEDSKKSNIIDIKQTLQQLQMRKAELKKVNPNSYEHDDES